MNVPTVNSVKLLNIIIVGIMPLLATGCPPRLNSSMHSCHPSIKDPQLSVLVNPPKTRS